MVFKMKKLDYSKDTNKVVSTSLVFYINLCLFYKDQDFMIDWIWEIRETMSKLIPTFSSPRGPYPLHLGNWVDGGTSH